jgi:hypothetical protein
MRSAFLFLRGTDVAAVAGLLGRLCSSRQGPPDWVVERDGNACLYVRLHGGGLPEHDAEPESHSAIRSALGADPEVTVTVDWAFGCPPRVAMLQRLGEGDMPAVGLAWVEKSGHLHSLAGPSIQAKKWPNRRVQFRDGSFRCDRDEANRRVIELVVVFIERLRDRPHGSPSLVVLQFQIDVANFEFVQNLGSGLSQDRRGGALSPRLRFRTKPRTVVFAGLLGQIVPRAAGSASGRERSHLPDLRAPSSCAA